jgi:bis(5'-nucleosidyl)-tetraphosphatase
MIENAYGIIPFHRDTSSVKVFLIHQYGSGGDTLWTFPKGRPEPNETPLQTAVRECKEETGINPVHIEVEHPVSTSYVFERRGEQVEKTSTYYVALVDDATFTIQPEEVKEAGWFAIEDARERLTFPDYKVLLNEAVRILDNLL